MIAEATREQPLLAACGARKSAFTPLLFLLAAAGALAASSNRIVIAPGFELYLGPLFYLLAYWLWGVRVGVVAAIVLMIPTYFWWGHPVSILMAAGHVLFIHWMRRRNGSYGSTTLLFNVTIGAAAGYLYVTTSYQVPPALATLLILRKLLNDVLLAAIVDAVRLFLRVDRQQWAIRARGSVSLPSAVSTSTMLFAVVGCMALFVIEVRHFDERFRNTLSSIDMSVRLLAGSDNVTREGLVGARTIQTPAGSWPVVLAPDRIRLGSDASVARQLGCTRIDDGRTVIGPNDRSTFAYWVNACQVVAVDVDGRQLVYAASLRPIALEAYQRLLQELLGFGALAALGLLSSHWLKRLTRRTTETWFGLIQGFGTSDLKVPAPVALKDFQPAIDTFVTANNAYVSVAKERERLSLAVTELKNAIDLTLAKDIDFDPSNGELRLVTLGSSGRAEVTHVVHEGDRQEIANLIGDEEVNVEFRLAGCGTDEWYMLIARAPDAQGRWSAGCVLRLRQAKVEHDRMLHQARLMDLGGMASALSHEIKQPLFTIALSAENALFYARQGDDPNSQSIASKLHRINEQVERAKSIIDQVSNYARIESSDGESFDPIEAVTASASFLRPLLVADDMRLTISSELKGQAMVTMSRVGLEQIIVNALQNAHDSIMARRQEDDEVPGRIEVTAQRLAGAIRISVADDGAGLAGEASTKAFEAFFTTKGRSKGTGLGLYVSRQIMLEAGGTLSLTDRPGNGAVLEISIPCEPDEMGRLA